MKIGQKIKELRQTKNLIQKELAAKLGVSVQSVAMWETGLRNPNPTQRKKLVEFFGINEADLFGPPTQNISPAILEALQDPVAVQALLITHKNSQDIKSTIKSLLETLPGLSPEKRQAILALCK